MALIDLPRFGFDFGIKIIFVWLVVAMIRSALDDQQAYMFDIGPREWAEITLASYGLVYAQYEYL